MFDQATPRFALPYIVPGQAQKEATHNESLARLDGLLACCVEAFMATPPADPEAGQAWVVAVSPTGLWESHGGSIAIWSGSGWRFVAPVPWMTVSVKSSGLVARFVNGEWMAPGSIAPATGGDVVDNEARVLLSQLLERLEFYGLGG